MTFPIGNLSDIVSHLSNLNPAQVTQPWGLAYAVFALVVGLLVGIVLRHAISLAIALTVLTILLVAGAGASLTFGGFFTSMWALLQPLLNGVTSVAFEDGVYSLAVLGIGVALGFFFTRS